MPWPGCASTIACSCGPSFAFRPPLPIKETRDTPSDRIDIHIEICIHNFNKKLKSNLCVYDRIDRTFGSTSRRLSLPINPISNSQVSKSRTPQPSTEFEYAC